MSTTDQEAAIAGTLRTSQIITGALIQGVVIFLAITVYLRLQKGPLLAGNPFALDSPLVLIALVLAPVLLAAAFLIPGAIATSQRRALLESIKLKGGKGMEPADINGGLMAIYQTLKIIALALLEGGAFFGLVVFMLEGNLLALGAAAVLLVVMVTQFPTRGSVDRFLDEQHRAIREGA